MQLLTNQYTSSCWAIYLYTDKKILISSDLCLHYVNSNTLCKGFATIHYATFTSAVSTYTEEYTDLP